jgi:hypothetical protein
MNKLLGNILAKLGLPFKIANTHLFQSLYNNNWLNLTWAVPASILTLPLLPFSLAGENVLLEIKQKEFELKIQTLESVVLPRDYCYIEESDEGWLVQPFFLDGEEHPFDTEEDAVLFLKTLDYKEVISQDCQRLTTFWIPNVKEQE